MKIVGKEKTLGNAAGGDGQATRTTAKCVGVIVKASPRDRAGIIAEFAKQIEVRSVRLSPGCDFLLTYCS